jgi:hypothetical protein
MLSSGANVIMVSSGANAIIWCYHVMLSSGMITDPFFIFPENFTHSTPLPFTKSAKAIPQYKTLKTLGSRKSSMEITIISRDMPTRFVWRFLN